MQENETTDYQTVEVDPVVSTDSVEVTQTTVNNDNGGNSENNEDTTLTEDKNSVEYWKKFSRKHETRVKELVSEKTSWETEKNNYSKTIEDLSSNLQSLKNDFNNSNLENGILKAISENGLPNDSASLITASTLEEVSEKAKSLAELLGTNSKRTIPNVLKSQGQSANENSAMTPTEKIVQWQKTVINK